MRAVVVAKNRVRDFALSEDDLVLAIFQYRFSLAYFGEKHIGIK
jgi:hypothetical protein